VELARRCGMEMPATWHFDLDRRLSAFGARRFDPEDGMRGAGLYAGRPAACRLPSAVGRLLHLLRATRLMTRDQRQIDAAFQRCVFNVVFNKPRDRRQPGPDGVKVHRGS
jgi:serine/threonine-protein kinase HipA